MPRTKPKCPSCNCTGVDKVTCVNGHVTLSGGESRFMVIHCAECGHVYNATPLIVYSIAHSPWGVDESDSPSTSVIGKVRRRKKRTGV